MKGPLTYAVGDLHGRADLLGKVLYTVMNHASDRGQGHTAKVVFLGDYVDRGPHSFDVVDSLMQVQQEADPDRFICLKGNHEDLFVRAFKDRTRLDVESWFYNGATETLKSYGWNPGDQFEEHVPKAHVNWLDGLPTVYEDDLRIFVHAGLIPGVPVDQHDEHDLIWIRQAFLRGKPGDFPKYVVHGHTHTEEGKETFEPLILDHRCNLDVASYHFGRQCIAVFNNEQAAPAEILWVEA